VVVVVLLVLFTAEAYGIRALFMFYSKLDMKKNSGIAEILLKA